MVKDDVRRNGRITPDTAISLKLVFGVAFIIIAIMGCWHDLKGDIRDVHHRIDLYHRIAETHGTS